VLTSQHMQMISLCPDLQTAFWQTGHALAAATAAAFSRHGVHRTAVHPAPAVAEDGRRPARSPGSSGWPLPHRDQGRHLDGGGSLLRREPHPGDRRLVRLVLTERGRSLEDAIAAETDKLTERALATLGPPSSRENQGTSPPSGATSPDLNIATGQLPGLSGSRMPFRHHGGHN
jgi:hypothetical protein